MRNRKQDAGMDRLDDIGSGLDGGRVFIRGQGDRWGKEPKEQERGKSESGKSRSKKISEFHYDAFRVCDVKPPVAQESRSRKAKISFQTARGDQNCSIKAFL
jgi:hypothetical protein